MKNTVKTRRKHLVKSPKRDVITPHHHTVLLTVDQWRLFSIYMFTLALVVASALALLLHQEISRLPVVVVSQHPISITGTVYANHAEERLYTNRTLRRDHDPLLVVHAHALNHTHDPVASLPPLVFNSCGGTTLRHHCRRIMRTFTADELFTQMFQNGDEIRTESGTLSPQLQYLLAMAAEAQVQPNNEDALSLWLHSLSLIDILLSDIVYDYIPDKNR